MSEQRVVECYREVNQQFIACGKLEDPVEKFDCRVYAKRLEHYCSKLAKNEQARKGTGTKSD